VKVETVAGKVSVGVRLKAIKQDPRMQRPEALGDGDWVWIGQSEGPCDLILWLKRFYSFFNGVRRGDHEPFFLARDTGPRDHSRILTYSRGMADVRELWTRVPGVTPEVAKTCGLHGLRVAGNNGVTRILGKEVARAQGGWASHETRRRYDRVDLADVVTIPSAMAQSWAMRERDFDFSAVQPAQGLPLPAPPPTPPPPPPQAQPPPVERLVRPLPATQRNVRRGAQPCFGPSPRAAARSSGCSRSRPPRPAVGRVARAEAASTSALQTHGPVQAPPLPPMHASAQRRDEASSHLSLTRPVRSARLAPVRRLPASLPGSWSSSPA